jgi:glucan phosphoethanolaminetransferase (alkaline phosphatase superfamily)
MVLQALNLGILTLLFFVIGMIKPKWALFFMEKPSRWLITVITTVFFMITMTLYGEGMRQAKLLEKHMKPSASISAPAPEPIAEPVPVPVPEAPKAAPKKK